MEFEVKDDLHVAVGLATYSNSESIVWTHTSFFENLWIQAELQMAEHTPELKNYPHNPKVEKLSTPKPSSSWAFLIP